MTTARTHFSCPRCDQPPSPAAIAASQCEGCGAALAMTPDPAGRISPERGGAWRYSAFLPCDYHAALDPHEAIRAVRAPTLARTLGIADAWLIDCTGLGTGTFKDLEAQVGLAAAADLGIEPLWIFSTGNTARAYHEWATRIDLRCTVAIPAGHERKLHGCAGTERQPIVLIDQPPAAAAATSQRLAAQAGARYLAAFGWKLEGSAAVAYAMAEHCPDIDVIVQTVGSGYGPLGYELGFTRAAAIDLFASAAVVHRHRYLLFQPADAAILAAAWNDPQRRPPDVAGLPAQPFEPTLQSTNGPATIERLRALPVERLDAVAPDRVLALRPAIDAILSEAGVVVDYDRERSTHIALAGLLDAALPPSARAAVIVTGASPFPD